MRLNESWYAAVLPDGGDQRRYLDPPVWLLLPMALVATAVAFAVGLLLALPDWWNRHDD